MLCALNFFFLQFPNYFHSDYLMYTPLCVHIKWGLESGSFSSVSFCYFDFTILVPTIFYSALKLHLKNTFAFLKIYQEMHKMDFLMPSSFPCVIEVVHYSVSFHACLFHLFRDHLEKRAYCNQNVHREVWMPDCISEGNSSKRQTKHSKRYQ